MIKMMTLLKMKRHVDVGQGCGLENTANWHAMTCKLTLKIAGNEDEVIAAKGKIKQWFY